MSQSPSPEHAPPAEPADALAAVDQVGEHAQVLADELAGGFDDIEAVRAAAPEGFDAGRDLDALLAAAAGGALDEGYELTHAQVDDPPLPAAEPSVVVDAGPEPSAFESSASEPAATADPAAGGESPEDSAQALEELVAAAFLENEAADVGDTQAPEAIDELLGAAFLDPDEVAQDAAGQDPEEVAADPMDDADAFAAALLEAHAAETEAPAPEAAPVAAEESPVEPSAPAAAQEGPPQVNPERIQDAIAAMEALLAQEAEPESAADTAADATESLESSPSAEADAAGAASAAAVDAVGEDELAGLFAAPDVAAGTGTGAGSDAPVVRALSDTVDTEGGGAQDTSTPPIHPDAVAAEDHGADAEGAQGVQLAFFPFGWMIVLLALINRPLERLSDEWRLAVSGVALAVAVPGALLLSYALFLK